MLFFFIFFPAVLYLLNKMFPLYFFLRMHVLSNPQLCLPAMRGVDLNIMLFIANKTHSNATATTHASFCQTRMATRNKWQQQQKRALQKLHQQRKKDGCPALFILIMLIVLAVCRLLADQVNDSIEHFYFSLNITYYSLRSII